MKNILSIAVLTFLAVKATAANETKLTFDNTQAWGVHEKHFLDTWQPKYIKRSSVNDSLKSFPKPPAHDSEAGKREMAYLLSLQKLRSPETEAIIEREKHVCGFWLSDYRMGLNESLDQLILDAYFDSRLWGFAGKHHFDRVRPSFLDSALKPSIANPPHPAYPSNHTFQAIVMAQILGKVFPEKSAEFMQDALNIARNREIAGVHYPSDTEASIVMAKEFLELLFANKSIQNQLNLVTKAQKTTNWRKAADTKDYKTA